jgi:hypothetical protein
VAAQELATPLVPLGRASLANETQHMIDTIILRYVSNALLIRALSHTATIVAYQRWR